MMDRFSCLIWCGCVVFGGDGGGGCLCNGGSCARV